MTQTAAERIDQRCQEVEARHVSDHIVYKGGIPTPQCAACGALVDWPCDAVQMARALRQAAEALELYDDALATVTLARIAAEMEARE